MATGRALVGPFSTPFHASDVAVNADGSLVAVAGGPTGDLAVYRTADRALTGTLAGLANPTASGSLVTPPPSISARRPDLPRRRVRTYPRRRPDDARHHLDRERPLLSSHNQVAVTDTVVLAAGDEAVVGVDRATGALLWSVPRTAGSNACAALAVADSSGRFYCRNVFGTTPARPDDPGGVGRLEERDLATGVSTGVVFDPQLGTVGDVAVTADERELVAFSHNAPVISRWRLDGTVTARVADGRVGVGYDPTGPLLLVSHRADPALFQEGPGRLDDWYVWDPALDQMVDPLDGVRGPAGWAGPPGEVAAVFTDRTAGFYDLETGTRTIIPLESGTGSGWAVVAEPLPPATPDNQHGRATRPPHGSRPSLARRNAQ